MEPNCHKYDAKNKLGISVAYIILMWDMSVALMYHRGKFWSDITKAVTEKAF